MNKSYIIVLALSISSSILGMSKKYAYNSNASGDTYSQLLSNGSFIYASRTVNGKYPQGHYDAIKTSRSGRMNIDNELENPAQVYAGLKTAYQEQEAQ